MLYLCLAPSVRFWLKPQKLTNPLESKQPMLGRNLEAVLVLERWPFDRVKKIERMCSLSSKYKQMPGSWKFSLGCPLFQLQKPTIYSPVVFRTVSTWFINSSLEFWLRKSIRLVWYSVFANFHGVDCTHRSIKSLSVWTTEQPTEKRSINFSQSEFLSVAYL